MEVTVIIRNPGEIAPRCSSLNSFKQQCMEDSSYHIFTHEHEERESCHVHLVGILQQIREDVFSL